MSLMDENDAKACAELFRKFVDQIEDGKPYDHVMAVTAKVCMQERLMSMRLTRRRRWAYLAHVIDDTYGGNNNER
jgi:hypothetical protein